MPQELADKLKMLGRYAISGGVLYAAGAGWIKPEHVGAVTSFFIDMGALTVACLPPAYAWLKVRNEKKPSRRPR